MSVQIGIDLGGTKTEIIALADDGGVLARRRVATPPGDYAAIVRTIATLVHDVESALGVPPAPIGIGTPGAISPATGTIKNANTTCLNGKALDRDLQRALGRPVVVANDANCFALSEATDGAAAGAEVVFGVILGTGVGGGLVVRGQALRGRNAIAGEWGHNPLPWPEADERPGPPCYCGKAGCIETFLSGPGLRRDHGGTDDAPAIVAAAQRGDARARGALTRYFDRLARALAHVVNVVDPDSIVLGGGLSNIEGIAQEVLARLRHHVFSDRVDTAVVLAQHGDSSGVRGAAWLSG